VAKGATISELRWPGSGDFVALAEAWRPDASNILLRFVWAGHDRLCREVLCEIDSGRADEDMERDITQLLEPRIGQGMTGFEPFDVQHGSYERETRKPSPAQPPAYDIAFVLRQNPRVMWPLEAKVLRTDGAVAGYVTDIKNEFLKCRYAPFSSEGGMLAYLLSGNPATAFSNIAQKLRCRLTHHPDFPHRQHKFSDHTRPVPRGRPYPRRFRCHHLVFDIAVGGVRPVAQGDS